MDFLCAINHKRRFIIVLILVLIEISTVFGIFKCLKNKEYKLDEVKELNKDKNSMFAMYTRIGNSAYTLYEPVNNEFPSGFYILNIDNSGCIDSDGNELSGVIISYEEGEIAVKTTKTMYCYLYFDFYITASELTYDNNNEEYTECTNSQCAIDELYNLLKPGVSEELIYGLHRYQGTIADNYICFGTTNKNTCTSDTDKYMYRIIGIDEDDKMKLIKKEALNTAYVWHSSNQTLNTPWSDSDLKAGLNGSYFLTNTNYVPDSTWSNRIATVNWKYGDITNTSANITEIATTETGWTNSVSAKIGLMYLHDYICADTNVSINWLALLNNDPSAPNLDYEWTMTKHGYNPMSNRAWIIDFTNKFFSYETKETASVRPVFYLTASQTIASGDGTLNNPFILG